MVDVDYDWDMP